MLSGDLDMGRDRLAEAVRLHRALDTDTGLAHALQRLAEAHLHLGERVEAERVASEALTRARWSPLSQHLLQRTYGTLIAAARTPGRPPRSRTTPSQRSTGPTPATSAT